MPEYNEITQLIHLQKTYQLRVEALAVDTGESFIKVRFLAGGRSWEVYVDNEYGYFDPSKQLLGIYLVLSAVDHYHTADDYLVWCNDNGLNASEPQWLDYYRGLDAVYKEIESIIGKIDPFITSFDYELHAGAFSALLK